MSDDDGSTELGLAKAIDEIRQELAQAVDDAQQSDVYFPVGDITIQFQVGVKKKTGGKGGFKFYVLELAAQGEYAKESVQQVTVTLQAPVDADGQRIYVRRQASSKPS